MKYITAFFPIFLILFSFILGLYLYPWMPEQMASHWNIYGQVDGYCSKIWGLFSMPVVSLILYISFLLVPRIDPRRSNIEKFKSYFARFVMLSLILLFYMYLLTIIWNAGIEFNMIVMLVPSFTLLYYCAGVLIENARRNWFIGIRTPWTLESDIVWDKTHKLGGKLFKIAAVINLAGVFIQPYAFFITIVPVIVFSLFTVFYSFYEYRKLNNPSG